MNCLLLLIATVYVTLAYPSIEDNALPTEEEIERELMGRGQPEVVSSLGLPTDDESIKQLQSIFELSQMLKNNRHHQPSGGHHFFISSFPEIDARGFHESVFDTFGGYQPTRRGKRDPFGISARGFHDDVFSQDFGNFHTVKKRSLGKQSGGTIRSKRQVSNDLKPQNEKTTKQNDTHIKTFKRNTNQIDYGALTRLLQLDQHGKRAPFADDLSDDAFSQGFGEFAPLKRNIKTYHAKRISGENNDIFTHGFGEFDTMKRALGMGSSGFHGDTFSGGFGDFDTMRKRRPMDDFHGDTFTQGFGDFDVMRKRRPGSDFHGDAFTEGFGDFDTMRKRRPMDDFHGDTFTQGFGDFDVMRKRRPGADFHGDAFTEGFGDFDTMKKRRPMEDFHGDTFTQGFGDFSTMKRNRLENEINSDAFTEGFGQFETMRKKRNARDLRTH